MDAVHCRIQSRQMGIRLGLRLMNSSSWKSHFSPRVLRQRKCAYFESLCPCRDNDKMTSYRRRSDVSGVRMSPSADEYASLGTSFTNLFGTRGSQNTFETMIGILAEQPHEHKTHEPTRSQQQSTRGVSNAAPHQHRQISLHPRLLRRLCVTLHWYVRRGK